MDTNDEKDLDKKISSELQSLSKHTQAAFLGTEYSQDGRVTSTVFYADSSRLEGTSTTDSLSADDLLNVLVDLPKPLGLEVKVTRTKIRDAEGRPAMVDLTASAERLYSEMFGGLHKLGLREKPEPYLVLVDEEGLRNLQKIIPADLQPYIKIRYLPY